MCNVLRSLLDIHTATLFATHRCNGKRKSGNSLKVFRFSLSLMISALFSTSVSASLVHSYLPKLLNVAFYDLV